MWIKLIAGLVLSYVSYLLTPKPKAPKAATLDQFNVPRAQEGAEASKIYGTRWVKSLQAAWYGHLRSEAIKDGGGKK